MIWKYVLSWLGMMVPAILNGGLRDLAYKQSAGVLAAHQISTAALLVLLSVYFWLLTRIIPFESPGQAWTVGVIWFVMTEVFEFGMGLSAGKSWAELMQTYDLMAGRVWVLIPVWVLIGLPIFFRFVQAK